MYKLFILPSAQKDCDKLSQKIFSQIRSKLVILEHEPRPIGAIKMTSEEGYRIRTGDYRILYRVDDKKRIIYIYRIKHRKDVYR